MMETQGNFSPDYIVIKREEKMMHASNIARIIAGVLPQSELLTEKAIALYWKEYKEIK